MSKLQAKKDLLFALIAQYSDGISVDPFEQSFFLLVYLPYLQPFIDVNKRVSRLAANIPLIRKNLSPLSFVDVPEKEYTQGLLTVYERNRTELLRDVFMWAYERSAALYTATVETLGEPDPFRVRYRAPIAEAILCVVQNRKDKQEAAVFIAKFAAAQIPSGDRARFVEVVEVELRSLHESNFARYKVRPAEFFL